MWVSESGSRERLKTRRTLSMTLSSCGGGGGGGERGGGEDGWLEAARGRYAIVDVFFI